jgi:anti-anti-sigma regulatory factor
MNPSCRLQLASGDHQIVFRPDGRCSALIGQAILRFIRSVEIGPEDDVYFDLSAADALESTFAGMLVILAKQGQKRGRPFVHLVTPSQHVVNALRQMGIITYFDVCSALPTSLGTWNSLPIEKSDPDELANLIIQSHEGLMSADPRNAEQFRGVVECFKAAKARRAGEHPEQSS